MQGDKNNETLESNSVDENQKQNQQTWKHKSVLINTDVNLVIEGAWNLGAWFKEANENTIRYITLSMKGYPNPTAVEAKGVFLLNTIKIAEEQGAMEIIVQSNFFELVSMVKLSYNTNLWRKKESATKIRKKRKMKMNVHI